MRHMLINHLSLTVLQYTGSEGPSHDPYGYLELHVNTKGKEIVLHEGLGVYIDLNGERITAPSEAYDKPYDWFEEVVMENTGFRLKDMARWSRKAKRQCRSGGRHDVMSVDGYPGETFDFCTKCGTNVNSYFCESAVI